MFTDAYGAKGEQAIAYYEETLRRRHQASENEKAQNDRKDIGKVKRVTHPRMPLLLLLLALCNALLSYSHLGGFVYNHDLAYFPGRMERI